MCVCACVCVRVCMCVYMRVCDVSLCVCLCQLLRCSVSLEENFHGTGESFVHVVDPVCIALEGKVH